MKKFFTDFKAFIARGNVIDMAVGVVIGGAFGKIVTALVNNIIMPLVSLATGGKGVSDWKWVFTEATYDASGKLLTAESALTYGVFIQSIIDFIIIGFCIFCFIRLMMKLHIKKDRLSHAEIKVLKAEGKSKAEIEAVRVAKFTPVPTPAPVVVKTPSEELLIEIRDLLKDKKVK